MRQLVRMPPICHGAVAWSCLHRVYVKPVADAAGSYPAGRGRASPPASFGILAMGLSLFERQVFLDRPTSEKFVMSDYLVTPGIFIR
jgi:hypothetical protein